MLIRSQLRRLATVMVAAGTVIALTANAAQADESVSGKQTLAQHDCGYQWNAAWGSGIGYAPQASEITFGGYTDSGDHVDDYVHCTLLDITDFDSMGWALYDQDHKLVEHKYALGKHQAAVADQLGISASGPWYLAATSTWGRKLRCATYYYYSNMNTENDVNYEPPHDEPGAAPASGSNVVPQLPPVNVSLGMTTTVGHTVNGVENSINVPGVLAPLSTSVDVSDPAANPSVSTTVPNPGAPDANVSDYPPVINTMLTQETGDLVATGNPSFDAWMNSSPPSGSEYYVSN